jgi:hypothetical protein
MAEMLDLVAYPASPVLLIPAISPANDRHLTPTLPAMCGTEDAS